MLSGKQKKQPRYSFCRLRSRWAVYDDETSRKVCDFLDREEARKKVYELNGWDYQSNNY